MLNAGQRSRPPRRLFGLAHPWRGKRPAQEVVVSPYEFHALRQDVTLSEQTNAEQAGVERETKAVRVGVAKGANAEQVGIAKEVEER